MALKSREELEAEVRSLRLQLEFAVHASRIAKKVLVDNVSFEIQKSRTFKAALALVEAVASENGFAEPMIALVGMKEGMRKAVEVAVHVATRGGDEWAAGCTAVAKEIEEILGR